MREIVDYRKRAVECLDLACTTHDPQTRIWAIEFAALLQRLSIANARKSQKAARKLTYQPEKADAAYRRARSGHANPRMLRASRA